MIKTNELLRNQKVCTIKLKIIELRLSVLHIPKLLNVCWGTHKNCCKLILETVIEILMRKKGNDEEKGAKIFTKRKEKYWIALYLKTLLTLNSFSIICHHPFHFNYPSPYETFTLHAFPFSFIYILVVKIST